MCSFGRGLCEERFCEIILNLMKVKRIEDIKIFLFKLWRPFCSAKRWGLQTCGRGHYEEHLREFLLNLGQWLRRRFKNISVNANLVKGNMRNIHVKLYQIWFSGSGNVILKIFLRTFYS